MDLLRPLVLLNQWDPLRRLDRWDLWDQSVLLDPLRLPRPLHQLDRMGRLDPLGRLDPSVRLFQSDPLALDFRLGPSGQSVLLRQQYLPHHPVQ